MFFAAHETKGYTLEEMDDIFDSGIRPWQKRQRPSRLDALQQQIVRGSVVVEVPRKRVSEVSGASA